ncbi:MAG: hypothetical protein JWN98_2417 [Abditibacteriota bacterium]|nr:hypothetical protein [Abditibacteriota bacterium]
MSNFSTILSLSLSLPLCSTLLTPLQAQNTAPRTSRPATTMSNRPTAQPAASANTSDILTRYQNALDQIAQGRFLEARALLQAGLKSYGNAPELNLLLGYLLEREGRINEAREVLSRVAAQSPAAAAYVTSLQGKRDVPRTAPHPPVEPAVSLTRGLSLKAIRLETTDQRLAKLERTMAQMVNAERAKLNLTPLLFDDELAAVGRAHSAEMRDLNYFSHDSPTRGLTAPLDRYRAAFNRTPRLVAENIYRVWGTQHRLGEEDIRAGHTALMNSPGHRANILLPNATRIGIGIVVNANGDIWLTQMFDRP